MSNKATLMGGGVVLVLLGAFVAILLPRIGSQQYFVAQIAITEDRMQVVLQSIGNGYNRRLGTLFFAPEVLIDDEDGRRGRFSGSRGYVDSLENRSFLGIGFEPHDHKVSAGSRVLRVGSHRVEISETGLRVDGKLFQFPSDAPIDIDFRNVTGSTSRS